MRVFAPWRWSTEPDGVGQWAAKKSRLALQKREGLTLRTAGRNGQRSRAGLREAKGGAGERVARLAICGWAMGPRQRHGQVWARPGWEEATRTVEGCTCQANSWLRTIAWGMRPCVMWRATRGSWRPIAVSAFMQLSTMLRQALGR